MIIRWCRSRDSWKITNCSDNRIFRLSALCMLEKISNLSRGWSILTPIHCFHNKTNSIDWNPRNLLSPTALLASLPDSYFKVLSWWCHWFLHSAQAIYRAFDIEIKYTSDRNWGQIQYLKIIRTIFLQYSYNIGLTTKFFFLYKYMYTSHHQRNKNIKLDVRQVPRYVEGAWD